MIYDDKKFIGQVIRNARKNKHLSQAALAEKIEMCDKNLGNIENGRQFPQVNNFLRLMEVLDLSVKDFGVDKVSINDNDNKDELLKLIYSSSPAKAKMYLQALHFIDSIIDLK